MSSQFSSCLSCGKLFTKRSFLEAVKIPFMQTKTNTGREKRDDLKEGGKPLQLNSWKQEMTLCLNVCALVFVCALT